jgi:hypothetical protein
MFPRQFIGQDIKKAALTAALDISLRRMQRSPDRLARNLLELGITAFPDKLNEQEKALFLQELIVFCKNGDSAKARELFLISFLS